MSEETPSPSDELSQLDEAMVAAAAHRIFEDPSTPARNAFEAAEWEAMVDEKMQIKQAGDMKLHASEEALKDENAAHTQTRRELKDANERANHDKLTGLYNRDAFLEHLDNEIGHFRREGDSDRVHQIAMIDIDDFKVANDTWGHKFGDKVLLSLTRTLEDELGENGHLVARWGGEEFVVLLKDTNTIEAMEMLDNVRRLVKNTRFEVGENHGRPEYYKPITVSIGVAGIKQRGEPDVAIDQADMALYASKFEGKNLVKLYEEGMQHNGKKQIHIDDRRSTA